MNNCINTKEPNKNAGMSSNKVEDPSITYKKGKEVGINDGNKIRTDGRTLNNYLLEHGLGLGKIRKEINKYKKPSFGLPTIWNEFIEYVKLENTIHRNTKIDDLIKKIENDNGNDYKPYPGIIRAVISSIDDEGVDEEKLNSLCKEYISMPMLYQMYESILSFADEEEEKLLNEEKLEEKN
jgi:hypothetical protein